MTPPSLRHYKHKCMNLNKEKKFFPSPDVLFQKVGGETVLLDLASESYFGLDIVGTRVWKILTEGHSMERMLNILMDEYEVEREQLEQDVWALLDSLLDAGLIKVHAP